MEMSAEMRDHDLTQIAAMQQTSIPCNEHSKVDDSAEIEMNVLQGRLDKALEVLKVILDDMAKNATAIATAFTELGRLEEAGKDPEAAGAGLIAEHCGTLMTVHQENPDGPAAISPGCAVLFVDDTMMERCSGGVALLRMDELKGKSVEKDEKEVKGKGLSNKGKEKEEGQHEVVMTGDEEIPELPNHREACAARCAEEDSSFTECTTDLKSCLPDYRDDFETLSFDGTFLEPVSGRQRGLGGDYSASIGSEDEDNWPLFIVSSSHEDLPLFNHISNTPTDQARKVESVDKSELFSQFVNALNGGGRLGGFQDSWLGKRLDEVKASKGHGGEYMYLLELVLTLQEQLKMTWDRQDHKDEKMEERWAISQKDGEELKYVGEMLDVVREFGWRKEDFAVTDRVSATASAHDEKKLERRARAILAWQRNARLVGREEDFLKLKKAVGDGLDRSKVCAPWFPSEEAVGHLIDECFAGGLQETKHASGKSDLMIAASHIFREYKDHTGSDRAEISYTNEC